MCIKNILYKWCLLKSDILYVGKQCIKYIVILNEYKCNSYSGIII